MKFLAQLLLALSAVPALVHGQSSRQSSVNVFQGRTMFVQSVYKNNMLATAKSFRDSGDTTNANRATTIANTASTFVWYYSVSAQTIFENALRDAQAVASTGQKIVFPMVIYNMPDRDCSSQASNGELQFDNDGLNKYKQMIDTIASTISRYPDFNYAIVVEPDSLANMVSNAGVNRCQSSLFDKYIDAYAYVITKFQQNNVALYIDVAHSAWLGWPEKATKVADSLQKILQRAGSAKIRGYVTNVSNYQPYQNPNPKTTNPNYDESHYGKYLGNLMSQRGLPSQFIHDTGRSGRPEALVDGVWCNLKNAGYGARPTTNTGDSQVDAFVWVKPPGDSDGSSIQGGQGYDSACNGGNSLTPSPPAGSWFLEYSKMLVRNANPSIDSSGSVTQQPTSSQQPTSTAQPQPTGGSGGSIPKYGQCGGIGWQGSGTCESGSTCVKSNDWYSQCV